MRSGDVVGRRVEQVMGTAFSLDLRDPVPLPAVDGVIEWLHWVDATFSPFRPDSDISRLGRGEVGLDDCEPEVGQVLAVCDELEILSGGAFSVGYGGGLDPSGYVKGWAVEQAAAMLTDAGSRRHAVNGGGDVRVVGRPEPGRQWQIGVADPFASRQLATVVALVDGGLATSGTAERGLHVVDPSTGLPATGLASLSVVGPDLGLADAYATAGLAMGARARPWLETVAEYEAFGITADGVHWQTTGFGGRVATFTAVSQPVDRRTSATTHTLWP